MIGHEPLIRMRIARKRPKSVWVWVGMDKGSWAARWHLYSDLWAFPEVVIEPTDQILTLDLRFLVGLQVHLGGDDTNRLVEAHIACMKAGVSDVFTLINDELVWDKGEEVEFS